MQGLKPPVATLALLDRSPVQRSPNKERVAAHGEVFTPPWLVNAMLDLVAQECEKEDSRFLEPACGDGNFLTEVLRRRLASIDRRYRVQSRWEMHALIGLACLYGIELLPDNVARCQLRLGEQFRGHYEARYGRKARPEVVAVARLILATNIVQGDALSMTGPTGEPLVLTEWSLVGRKVKRKLYEYKTLVAGPAKGESLFDHEPIVNDLGEPYTEVRHVRDLPLVHYLALAKEWEGR
ncbi:MAG: type III restriction endonuclease subunit M [Chthonomonas sp.]